MSWLVILSLLFQPVAPALAHYASSAPAANGRTFHEVSAVAPAASTPREMPAAPRQAQQPSPGGAVVYQGGLENAAGIPLTSGHKYWVYMTYDSTASAYIKVTALQNGQQKGMCYASYAGHKSCRFHFTPTTGDPLSLTVTSLWATPENVSVLVIDENSPTNRRVIYNSDVVSLSNGFAVEPGHRYLFSAAAFTGQFNVFLGYGWPVYPSRITDFCGVLSAGQQCSRPVYYAYAYERDKFYIQVTNVAKYTTGLIALIDLDLPPASAADAERTFAKEHACAANNGDADAADPVSTRTGNFTHQEVDVALSTRGLPLTFERSYNALDNYNGRLGRNWTHNYDTRIVDAGATATWIAPRGSHLPYTRNGDGSYTAGPGVRATLVKHPNGSYSVTQGDQTTYHFDAAGRLTALDNGRGNVTTLTYTGGYLTSIVAPDGRALSLTYDGQGRITQLADPLGRTVTYQYSGGNLTAVTDRRGYTWTYAYDSNGRMTAFSDPQGSVVTNVYDSLGRVVVQRNPLNQSTAFAYDGGRTVVTGPDNHTTTYVYSAAGLLASVTDALGHTTSYTYDSNGNIAAVTDPLGRTTGFTWNDRGCSFSRIADAMGHTTTLNYDERNNLLAITDPLSRSTRFGYAAGDTLVAITNTLGAVATFTYDAYGQMTSSTNARGETTATAYDLYGNLTAITDALGHTTHLSYDLVGRPTAITDANGYTTTFLYDAGDNLLGTTNPLSGATAYAYDLAGNLTAVTDANGHTQALAYDAAGRLITMTDALQGQTVFAYNAAGRVIRVTDAKGRATHFGYDGAGRLVTVTDALNGQTRYAYDAAGNVLSVTDPTNATMTFQYDALNRTVAITDALGHAAWFGYNAVGNVVAALDPTGRLIRYTYDALDRPLSVTVPGVGQVAAYAYDPAGNLTAVTDANGHVTQYGYDALNRLAQVIDPLSHVTSYGYDPVGNLSAVTDANAHTRTYVYDALNRLVAASNPLGHTTTYGYDAVGNTTVITDADGLATHYAYDNLNRVSAVQYPAVLQLPAFSVQYSYDAAGNRVAMTDTTGVTTYGYDALYRPTSITAPYAGTVGYRYDAAGRRTQTLYPGGDVVTYTYNAAGWLVGVMDWDGNSTTYSYDNAGRIRSATRPNAVRTDYDYDVDGRLTELAHTRSADTLAQYAYTLDDAGNRIQVAESVATPVPTPTPTPTPTPPPDDPCYCPPGQMCPDVECPTSTGAQTLSLAQADGSGNTYTYDTLDRLVTADYASGLDYTYTYDNVGNRTADEAFNNYTYDAADRLTGVFHWTYTYDNRGNLLHDNTWDYRYDGAGRMVRAESHALVDPISVEYTYNGDGLLVAENVNGAVKRFTWDQARDLPQALATSDGGRYLYGLDRLGMQQGGAWFYPLPDALGSVRQWTDAAGTAVGSQAYTPFGGPLDRQGMLPAPFGFAGEWTDAATGLQYLRARWYDPATGRFTQVDPFPGVLSLPETQHPYVYALNNPLRYTDPSGEVVIEAVVGAAVVGALIGGVAGGIGYAVQNPGRSLGEYVKNAEFRRAVGVGAVSGAVSGLMGLLSAGSFWGAVGLGALSGALVSGVGQITSNLLTPCTPWHQNLDRALLTGAISGAITGGVGYGIRQWLYRSNSSTIPASRVRFTQDSIGPNTKAGVPLDVLTQEIDNGHFRGTLRVVKLGGKFYSLDNRRLAAFKLLNHDVPVTLVSLEDPGILGEFTRKFTTINDGLSVIVRGTDLVIK